MHAFEPQREEPRQSRARKPTAPPAVRSTRKSRLLRAFLAIIQRPGRSLLILAGGALVASVMVNALFLQKGRHPAPLFATPGSSSSATPSSRTSSGPTSFSAPLPASRPTQTFEDVVAPERRSAPARTQNIAPVNAPVHAPAPVQRAAPARAEPARTENVDAIGAMLRGGGAAPVQASLNDPILAKRIIAAQRALEKLGFQVTADGVLGSGTRAAIQKFERERDLPVTGELNPRTLRTLGARSGVSIP